MLDVFKFNLKQLHGYIRCKKEDCTTVGPFQLQDNSLTNASTEMAEALATAFATVYRAV